MSVKNTKNVITNFETKCLAKLNRTEKEIQQDKVRTFIKRSQIDVQQQIGIRKNKLANLELDLELGINELEQAKEQFETARFTLANDFSEYISKRNTADQKVDEKKQNVVCIGGKIEQVKEEIEKLNEVLSDFS